MQPPLLDFRRQDLQVIGVTCYQVPFPLLSTDSRAVTTALAESKILLYCCSQLLLTLWQNPPAGCSFESGGVSDQHAFLEVFSNYLQTYLLLERAEAECFGQGCTREKGALASGPLLPTQWGWHYAIAALMKAAQERFPAWPSSFPAQQEAPGKDLEAWILTAALTVKKRKRKENSLRKDVLFNKRAYQK